MIIIYLIKSAISLFIFYVFYYFFISKDKMHLHKRIYLLFALIFSLIIPLIKINLNFFSSISLENNILVLQERSSNPNYFSSELAAGVIPSNNFPSTIIYIVYISVLTLLLLRFSINLYRLFKREKNQIFVKQGDYKIFLLPGDVVPYSFLNRIYVSREAWERGEIDEALIKHEIYHIKKRHSLDLIFVEMLQILFWFNPIIILYKREIRLNHEHQVDQKVIDDIGNVRHYQEILLSAASKNLYKQFASGFDSSLIKSRLIMMTAKPSSIQFRIKMLFIFPFIILMTASFVISQDFRDGNILANPHFIKMTYPKINGIWVGNGAFRYSRKLNTEIGNLDIKIEINDDFEISGKIGDASFTNASIEIAKYGLEITGELNGRVKNGHPLKKKHVVFLLFLPEIENNKLNAYFHMLNNVNWDKYMIAGSVMLTKAN